MIVDVNANVSRWPFRRLYGDEPGQLASMLRSRQFAQAWVGSLDGLFHKDVAAVNQRLADECRQAGGTLLLPFGTVNPMLPGWQEDLRRCHEVHQMAGIRLHPNYHGYKLDDPSLAELLANAAQRRLIVQIALKMEDERTQHPLMRVPTVDPAPLPALLAKHREARVVLLGALRDFKGETLQKLTAAGEVYFETSMLEGVTGIAKAIREVTVARLLFGSHAPLFYFESALGKLRESPLSDTEREAIRFVNARRLLAPPAKR